MILFASTFEKPRVISLRRIVVPLRRNVVMMMMMMMFAALTLGIEPTPADRGDQFVDLQAAAECDHHTTTVGAKLPKERRKVGLVPRSGVFAAVTVWLTLAFR